MAGKILQGTRRTNKGTAQRTKQASDGLRLKAFQTGQDIQLTEAETRDIIDQQLRDAGWEADTVNIHYQKGARPEKGKNKAIAEWPVKGGKADYALFIGEALYGIVEAKKDTKEVVSDMRQAKRYAVDADETTGGKFLGKWMNYKVPFMFATNSRGSWPRSPASASTTRRLAPSAS